jgi:hypothetical protein
MVVRNHSRCACLCEAFFTCRRYRVYVCVCVCVCVHVRTGSESVSAAGLHDRVRGHAVVPCARDHVVVEGVLEQDRRVECRLHHG